MRTFLTFAVAASVAFCRVLAFAQEESVEGWWIVITSKPNHETIEQRAANRRNKIGTVNICGIKAYSEYTSQFHEFRQGYKILVAGPYREKLEGLRYLAQVKNCAPSAYLKYSFYVSE